MNGRIITSAALAILIASPAMATDWQIMGDQDEASPQAIFSTSETAADLLFSCNSDGKLKLLIGFSDKPINEQIEKRITYSRAETLLLTRGDDETLKYEVRWIPGLGLAQVTRHSAAAKVYNATVTGETVRFEFKRQDPVEMILPEVNAAFSAFSNTCNTLRAEAA